MSESSGQEYRRTALDDLGGGGNPVRAETPNKEAGQAPSEQQAAWVELAAKPAAGEETPPQDTAPTVDPAAPVASPGAVGIDTSGAPAADPTIGAPEEDAGTWDGQQGYDDTCTIRAQEFILEQFTGQEFDEAALVAEAEANGFYKPGGGTSFEHTGSLLELHGVGVKQYWDANAFQLANELAQGHKVILSVDSGELWGEEDPVRGKIAGIADRDVDHDVVVSGIDTTDPENPKVIVSDPGTGEVGAAYPMDRFLAAWQDSSFFMMATEEPVPSTAPEMANFPYEAGHIPEVACVPYEDFVGMQDQTQEWNELLDLIARDQTYVSQEAPPQTVYQDVVDREAPEGETVPPELLDPGLPGPTVDAGLFDPNAPGPTIDPCCVNPDAPGPTIDPALLDPNAAGPTIDPALLDPNSPGPTVDAGLFDPNSPGPTVDPSAPLAPQLQQPLQNASTPAAVSQTPAVTQTPVEQTSTGPGIDDATVPDPGVGPDVGPAAQSPMLEGSVSGQEAEPQPDESATEDLPDGSI